MISSVDDQEIGRYMLEKGMLEVEEVREKPGDDLSMKKTKRLIGEMLERYPKSRPSAQELVYRFTRLCSAYTEVWKSLKLDGKLGHLCVCNILLGFKA
jgi:hypothetical protein